VVPGDPSREVVLAAQPQQRVEVGERRHVGDQNEMATTEATDLPLDAALLMGALQPDERELRLEHEVRPQPDEPVGSTRRRPLRTCLTADPRLS